METYGPAFFRVLVSLVVKLEGDLGVQPNAKIVVHDTLLRTLSADYRTGLFTDN